MADAEDRHLLRAARCQRVVIAIAVALAVVAASCGGDDSASTPARSPTPLSAPAEPEPSTPTPTATPTPTPLATSGLEFAPGRTLSVIGADISELGRPVVVVLRPSDHVELDQFLPTLAATGVVVFDAPWRPVEQGGRYPTVLEEVSCAIGYARDRAADFGGDPSTITLAAHSAGSYIAALTSFRSYDGDCTTAAGLPDRMVGIAGIYGALTEGERAEQDELMAALLDGPIEEHLDAYADLQPDNHLGEHPSLQALLIHGSIDDIVPVAQTTRWHELLAAAGYDTELRIADQGDHTSLLVDPTQAAMVARWIAAFARADI